MAISNGTYIIYNASLDTKALQANGDADGALIFISSAYPNHSRCVFKVANALNSSKRLICQSSGKSVDVDLASTDAGTKVQVWTETDSAWQGQRLSITETGFPKTICGVQYPTYYISMSNAPDMVFSPIGEDNTVQLASKGVSDARQRWVFIPVPSYQSSSYAILPFTNTRKAIDVKGNGTTNGTTVDTYTINGKNAQTFSFETAVFNGPSHQYTVPGFYRISCNRGGKYLTNGIPGSQGTGTGQSVYIYGSTYPVSSEGYIRQTWLILLRGVTTVNNTKCMVCSIRSAGDPLGYWDSSLTTVTCEDESGNTDQLWVLAPNAQASTSPSASTSSASSASSSSSSSSSSSTAKKVADKAAPGIGKWADQTRQGELHAYMISPQSLDDSYGELLDVDWSSLSISAGYYTDCRTSGSLDIVGGNWVRGSFIRIVYEIPEWNYTREIGTYAVVNDTATRKNGVWRTTLELQSMIWTMSKDLTPAPLTLATGSRASTALIRELKDAGREYVYPFGADAKMTGPTSLDSGQSKLSRAFILCRWMRCRLDVNGHGRITAKKYAEPASKTPALSLDLLDERGVVKDGVTRSTNWAEMPSSYIVLYKYTDKDGNGKSVDREIRAEVHLVNPKWHQVAANRGYEVSILENLNDMSPKTYAKAAQIAKERLLAKTNETVEWELECKYLPLWEGDVIELVIPDGISDYRGKRKCLVKSIDMKGPYLDMRLTLKEVYEGVADDDE